MGIRKIRVEYWDFVKILVLRDGTLPGSYDDFVRLLCAKIPPIEAAAQQYVLRLTYQDGDGRKAVHLEDDDDLMVMYESGESYSVTAELLEVTEKNRHRLVTREFLEAPLSLPAGNAALPRTSTSSISEGSSVTTDAPPPLPMPSASISKTASSALVGTAQVMYRNPSYNHSELSLGSYPSPPSIPGSPYATPAREPPPTPIPSAVFPAAASLTESQSTYSNASSRGRDSGSTSVHTLRTMSPARDSPKRPLPASIPANVPQPNYQSAVRPLQAPPSKQQESAAQAADRVDVVVGGKEYAFPLVWRNADESRTEDLMGPFARPEWALQRTWPYKHHKYSDFEFTITYIPKDPKKKGKNGLTPAYLIITILFDQRAVFKTAVDKYLSRFPPLDPSSFRTHLIDSIATVKLADGEYGAVVTEWACLEPPPAAKAQRERDGGDFNVLYIVKEAGTEVSKRTMKFIRTWAEKELVAADDAPSGGRPRPGGLESSLFFSLVA